MAPDRPGFLYVVSWEVCNRIGGVHTVLAGSAPYVDATYGEDLLYVGPDLWADRAAQAAFVEDAVPPPVAGLAADRDIPARFGHWEVDGRPRVALIDHGRLLERKNSILGDLWNDFGVDSIHADWDTVERILFGYAAGMLVELHYHAAVRPRAVRAVAHLHQWHAAAALLRLAKTTPEIGTVYTPHGSTLGRRLAAGGAKLHLDLGTVEPAREAKAKHVEARHTLEVAAARQASVLCEVSEHAADEAAHILGRRPDVITPNGFTPAVRPDAKHRGEVRAALFRCAERFLGSPVDPARTRLVFTSGRYEFRNKGLDLTLDVAGRLNRRGEKPPRSLLLLIAVAAPQTGPRPEVTQRLKDAAPAGVPCGVCTHNIAHPESDPILQACAEHGLANRPDDPVHVLFAPIRLDGRDPVLPFSYDDVLQAADLTVFASLYEPWGYTPVESLAAGVPTVTTDLTGFGRFVLGLPEEERRAVTVLPGAELGNGDLAEELSGELVRFLAMPDEQLADLRRAGTAIAARTSWETLIQPTLQAHEMAVARAGARAPGPIGPGLSRLSRRSLVVIPGRSTERPQLHRFTVAMRLPERLERLQELAKNPWWTWEPRARALFESLDEEAFREGRGNPVRMLRSIDARRMARAAEDPSFLERYDAVLRDFDAYRSRAPSDAPRTGYFCAEFAIHESLPIYSGGLGALAGDHLKSASDLGLPLVAVGLRYAHGYFVQRIEPDGRQGVEYVRGDPQEMPMTEVVDAEGRALRIHVAMPERVLHAGAWRVDVGAVPLYLLDALVPQNEPGDQIVTDRLYPSDRESRLRQEILLGIGGWRLLRALGKTPEVCHLNEGHSAFLLLERLRELVEEQGLTYAEAETVVRASTVFTTHTPVPAGHDRFSEGLLRRHFGPLAQQLGLDWDEFLDLGRTSREEHEFSMTVLALRLSGRANGVSELHGEVSREMLAGVWPGIHEAETPVASVTNGVHLPTWVGPEARELLDAGLGPGWAANHPLPEDWLVLENLSGGEVWSARQAQKRRMVEFLRESVSETGLRRGEAPAALRKRVDGITEDALWIGFARRFAPYKRALLLFHDEERIAKLLSDEKRPVRVVFAGKAHPDDGEGGELVRSVVRLTADPRFVGKVFFVEDYDLRVSRPLVRGTDVWLNTPTRPLEASGTSGMKACLNGGLHLSILDGWWCEGYDGDNGWAFGEGREYDNPELQKEHDSQSLYGLLETEVVPAFFERDEAGVPAGWVERIRRSLATIPGRFNTQRMVSDYERFAYAPLADEARELILDGYRGARERAARHARLRGVWDQVRIEDVSVTDLSRGGIGIGEVFEVRARVHLGELAPEDVAVELYVGPADPAGELRRPVVIPLLRDGETENGVAEFAGAYLPTGPGAFRYGIRVLPAAGDFQERAHLGLVRWA